MNKANQILLNPKIKKIIAREGLIFFLVIIGVLCLILEQYFRKHSMIIDSLIPQPITDYTNMMIRRQLELRHDYMMKSVIFHRIGFWSLISYAVYLAIHFITWAIRTLKAK